MGSFFLCPLKALWIALFMTFFFQLLNSQKSSACSHSSMSPIPERVCFSLRATLEHGDNCTNDVLSDPRLHSSASLKLYYARA